jgi:hypothetical protein
MEFFELTEKHGVIVRALDECIDTSSSIGNFYLSLIGSLAEMESFRISERVKHGKQHLRNNNVPLANTFGFRIENGKYVLNDSPAISTIYNKKTYTYEELARLYIKYFLTCKSLNGTLRLFNKEFGLVKSTADIKANRRRIGFSHHEAFKLWLTSPVLLGHVCYNRYTATSFKHRNNKKALDQSQWDIRLDTHQPLLSYVERATIDSIIDKFKNNKGFSSQRKIHPAAGLVYCAVCKSRMEASASASPASKKQPNPVRLYYYRCRQAQRGVCTNKKYIRVDLVEAELLNACSVELQRILSGTTIPTLDNTAVDEQLITLQKQLEGLENLGFNPALETAKRHLREQIASIAQQTENRVVVYTMEQDRLNRLKSLLHNCSNNLPDRFDFSELSEIYNTLVDKIWIQDRQIIEVNMKQYL